MNELEWLSLEEDEEVLWQGNPKLQKMLGFKHTHFIVTSRGVYRKTGIFSRNVQKIGFDKIQNISFSQGLIGKMFGHGNVEISTAGGSGVEMRFRSIENPKEVQQLINENIRQEDSEEGVRSQREILEKMLEELQQINEKI